MPQALRAWATTCISRDGKSGLQVYDSIHKRGVCIFLHRKVRLCCHPRSGRHEDRRSTTFPSFALPGLVAVDFPALLRCAMAGRRWVFAFRHIEVSVETVGSEL